MSTGLWIQKHSSKQRTPRQPTHTVIRHSWLCTYNCISEISLLILSRIHATFTLPLATRNLILLVHCIAIVVCELRCRTWRPLTFHIHLIQWCPAAWSFLQNISVFMHSMVSLSSKHISVCVGGGEGGDMQLCICRHLVYLYLYYMPLYCYKTCLAMYLLLHE